MLVEGSGAGSEVLGLCAVHSDLEWGNYMKFAYAKKAIIVLAVCLAALLSSPSNASARMGDVVCWTCQPISGSCLNAAQDCAAFCPNVTSWICGGIEECEGSPGLKCFGSIE